MRPLLFIIIIATIVGISIDHGLVMDARADAREIVEDIKDIVVEDTEMSMLGYAVELYKYEATGTWTY